MNFEIGISLYLELCKVGFKPDFIYDETLSCLGLTFDLLARKDIYNGMILLQLIPEEKYCFKDYIAFVL